MVSRRGFLGALATLAAGMTLDPERLLWVPGAKTIFDFGGIAPAPDFRYVDWITQDTLRILQNKLTVFSAFNRSYDEPFVSARQVLVGSIVDVVKPSRRWRA